MSDADALTPAEVCRKLLLALSASDGRRQRRKRDTTPDTIGMAIKRRLLERAVIEAPAESEFEGWLLHQCMADREGGGEGSGAIRAMALEILDDWRMAKAQPAFLQWLTRGAPSDDAME